MSIQNKLENAQSNFYYRRASRENYDRPRVLLKYGFIPLPSEFYACQSLKETKKKKNSKSTSIRYISCCVTNINELDLTWFDVTLV